MTKDNNKPEFEIVGLHCNSEGRSCTAHDICGKYVNTNDVLRLVSFIATVRDKDPEEAIKLVKIVDGTETCTVGFVPRSFARLDRIKRKVGQMCQVLEIYDASENKYKRQLSTKNYGVASCIFLDDVPRQE